MKERTYCFIENKMQEQNVILIEVLEKNRPNVSASMEELKKLTQTAGGKVVEVLIQKREKIDRKTLLGSGKVEELKEKVIAYEADLVIFNQPLSPRQGQYLSELLHIPVLDRIQLILDIFALRAKSKEGKLQVQLAQLNYLLPRLTGKGSSLSRLGGGIGTRGPGETKLETDRRHIRKKMNQIKQEVQQMTKQRKEARKKRKQSKSYHIGLIGYTNAGKSSLLNWVTESNTYEKDQLFATLDPLTKKWPFPNGMEVTLTDTVGFIQELPTLLIEAFSSTLEESADMDLLLHVVDASSPFRLQQEKTVIQLLEELHLQHLPILTVYNKKDLLNRQDFVPTLFPHCVISTKDTRDKVVLLQAIQEQMKKNMEAYELFVPVEKSYIMNSLKKSSFVVSEKYDESNQGYLLKGYIKTLSFLPKV